MSVELRETLDYIIQNKEIRSDFQPIISLQDGIILGHEALSRITCGCGIENPEMFSISCVQYGQGYYIQRPHGEVMDISGDLIDMIKRLNKKYNKNLFGMLLNRG